MQRQQRQGDRDLIGEPKNKCGNYDKAVTQCWQPFFKNKSSTGKQKHVCLLETEPLESFLFVIWQKGEGKLCARPQSWEQGEMSITGCVTGTWSSCSKEWKCWVTDTGVVSESNLATRQCEMKEERVARWVSMNADMGGKKSHLEIVRMRWKDERREG